MRKYNWLNIALLALMLIGFILGFEFLVRLVLK